MLASHIKVNKMKKRKKDFALINFHTRILVKENLHTYFVQKFIL